MLPLSSLVFFAVFVSLTAFEGNATKIGLKGYIGPACAVVDDDLYLHGLLIRKLDENEIVEFKKYQDGMNLVKTLSEIKFMSNDINLPPAPQIPVFCNGLDDTIEVVLEGCTVRNGRVYIQDKLIRPLNGLERDKVNSLLAAKSFPKMIARIKRAAESNKNGTEDGKSPTDDPLSATQNDISVILERFLNVNSTVAKRFLPLAKMSPLLAHVDQATRPGGFDFSKEFGKSLEAARASRDVADMQNTTTNLIEKNIRSAGGDKPEATTKPEAIVNMSGAQDSPTEEKTVDDPVILQLVQALLARQSQLKQPVATPSATNLQFHSYNHNQQSPPRFIIPINMGNGLRAGDKTVIGGQTYLAVPMNPAQSGTLPMFTNSLHALSSARQSPAAPQTDYTNVYGNSGNQNTNYYSHHPVRYNAGSTYHQPSQSVGQDNNIPIAINSNQPRYHPGNHFYVQSQPELPNEICRAHIIHS